MQELRPSLSIVQTNTISDEFKESNCSGSHALSDSAQCSRTPKGLHETLIEWNGLWRAEGSLCGGLGDAVIADFGIAMSFEAAFRCDCFLAKITRIGCGLC